MKKHEYTSDMHDKMIDLTVDLELEYAHATSCHRYQDAASKYCVRNIYKPPT